ncbi:SCO1664 family protein [Streptomyces albidoflavus]|uniref:SCO1664 family protein n=1 Tax=Streptomyces TaxID=1883 RepID=UPI0002C669F0|nr:SCO1664 family protein [Streptomyces albidoflavus]AGI91479.1 Phosphatidylinositol 3-and 4-kinase [Streptomyces albidoflavus]MCL6277048.1 SCO1664 family protein [Streptomyces albidoflavus]MCX4467625.1 SCO1664 family protein [Streptomyces albidoflavus]QLP95332.1 Phosphatidylinositol 3-and 4-kinase [Streptomyces albidoflavus]WAE13661.1 Phosphatidylinositol 3-and 4-kinase [Streptomyces albidoflavus]
MPAPERVPPGPVTTSPAEPAPAGSVTALLTGGELTVRGRIAEASNAVLHCTVVHQGRTAACVYKPVAGEQPLWDFPDGTLAQREVAAYEVCAALGWELIPPTVLREGPYGPGMVQLWIDQADEEPGERAEPGGAPEAGENAPGPVPVGHLLALADAERPAPEGWRAIGLAEVPGGGTALLVHADDARLRRLAVLDAVINNSDRKGGHLLTSADGRLHGIDHGVTFHTEDKLRTLLWGWAGEPLPEEAVTALGRLAAALGEDAPLTTRLAALLTPAEVAALRDRVAALLASGTHPVPGGEWPAIPWPPV